MLIALDYVLQISLGAVVIAILLCGIRMIMGPTSQDRVLALDAIWICTLALILLLGIRHGSTLYFEVAMLIALLGFVSTLALSKFLMRGEIIE